ncbi:hypothetical protein [Dysgonomonas massiliensis]|uniref:hypothetical protein n=1 Tax=Dysgonomonas massiliensis TaxID=2040292 RepID=UPI000C76F5A3|nr:hypothetical protein [Dysgonomonas massiliensis]
MKEISKEAFDKLSKESQEAYLKHSIKELEKEIDNFITSEVVNDILNDDSFNIQPSQIKPLSEDACNDMLIDLHLMRKNAKETEEILTKLHVFGADKNLPESTDAHSREDKQQNNK